MFAYTSNLKEFLLITGSDLHHLKPQSAAEPFSAAHCTVQVGPFLPLMPFLKALLSTAAPTEREAAHTTKVMYACYTVWNTTFSGSCFAQFAIIFLIQLISLFYNTFLTILTYILMWLAVFIVTFKFTHSSNDFQFLRVQWIICFRVLKKKNPSVNKIRGYKQMWIPVKYAECIVRIIQISGHYFLPFPHLL